MRHVRGEPPDGRQAVGLAHPLLHPLDGRQILTHADKPDRLAVPRAKRPERDAHRHLVSVAPLQADLVAPGLATGPLDPLPRLFEVHFPSEESLPGLAQRLLLGTATLGTGRMLMRTDYRGIQQQNAEVWILQFLHDRLEHAVLAPAIETLKDAVPLAKAFGQVTPRGAGFGDPHDGIDE